MPYNVKRSKNTTAKFKAFAVDGAKNFIDTETGQIVDVQDIVVKTFGEDTPVDISVSNKSEDDITPEE